MKLHCWSFIFGLLLDSSFFVSTCNLTIFWIGFKTFCQTGPSDKAVFRKISELTNVSGYPLVTTEDKQSQCTLSLDHHLVTVSFFVGKSSFCCLDRLFWTRYVFVSIACELLLSPLISFIVSWSHAISPPKYLLLVLLPFSCQIYSLRWPLSALTRLVSVL